MIRNKNVLVQSALGLVEVQTAQSSAVTTPRVVFGSLHHDIAKIDVMELMVAQGAITGAGHTLTYTIRDRRTALDIDATNPLLGSNATWTTEVTAGAVTAVGANRLFNADGTPLVTLVPWFNSATGVALIQWQVLVTHTGTATTSVNQVLVRYRPFRARDL